MDIIGYIVFLDTSTIRYYKMMYDKLGECYPLQYSTHYSAPCKYGTGSNFKTKVLQSDLFMPFQPPVRGHFSPKRVTQPPQGGQKKLVDIWHIVCI